MTRQELESMLIKDAWLVEELLAYLYVEGVIRDEEQISSVECE